MITSTRKSDPALDLLLTIDPRSPDDLRIANCALKLLGAELDDESPLTPVFVARLTAEVRDV